MSWLRYLNSGIFEIGQEARGKGKGKGKRQEARGKRQEARGKRQEARGKRQDTKTTSSQEARYKDYK